MISVFLVTVIVTNTTVETLVYITISVLFQTYFLGRQKALKDLKRPGVEQAQDNRKGKQLNLTTVGC